MILKLYSMPLPPYVEKPSFLQYKEQFEAVGPVDCLQKIRKTLDESIDTDIRLKQNEDKMDIILNDFHDMLMDRFCELVSRISFDSRDESGDDDLPLQWKSKKRMKRCAVISDGDESDDDGDESDESGDRGDESSEDELLVRRKGKRRHNLKRIELLESSEEEPTEEELAERKARRAALRAKEDAQEKRDFLLFGKAQAYRNWNEEQKATDAEEVAASVAAIQKAVMAMNAQACEAEDEESEAESMQDNNVLYVDSDPESEPKDNGKQSVDAQDCEAEDEECEIDDIPYVDEDRESESKGEGQNEDDEFEMVLERIVNITDEPASLPEDDKQSEEDKEKEVNLLFYEACKRVDEETGSYEVFMKDFVQPMPHPLSPLSPLPYVEVKIDPIGMGDWYNP
jgi:hypothetical protein